MVFLSSFFVCLLMAAVCKLCGATPCTTDDYIMDGACKNNEDASSFFLQKSKFATRGSRGSTFPGGAMQQSKESSAQTSSMEHHEGFGDTHLMDLLEEHTLEELHLEEELSEKHAAGSIDCADEVLLRLASAESFHGPSYDDCVAHTKKTALQKSWKGWGSGMTAEELERKSRQRCITRQGHGVALGPRLIRMTFHDAADYNNSQLPTGEPVPLDQTGVDACLRTALLSVGLSNKDDDDDLKDIAKGEPNHNRGLDNAIRWVLHMSSASKLTRPDMMVLGAVTAMEAWMGMSELGVQFGRRNGKCQKIVCNKEECWDNETPFFKQPVAEPVGSGMFCPMTNTLDPLRQVMGLSLEELVALQGAHSVGGVIVCSGLGNVANAPYCPQKCGIPPGNFWETGNLDGTSFDDTPGKMDNRYYQLLMNEEYEQLPACSEVNAHFPRLSKHGLSSAGKWSTGGKRTKDRSATCAAGIEYDPENVCEVEACVQNCSNSEICMEAQNIMNDDSSEFREAWQDCLTCKKLCSGSHSRKIAKERRRQELDTCKASCKISDACNRTKDWTWKECSTTCKDSQKVCREQATGSFDWKLGVCFRACRQKQTTGTRDCLKKPCSETKNCKKQVRSDMKNCFSSCRKTNDAAQTCSLHRKTCIRGCRGMSELQKKCRRCVADVCKPQADALQESIYSTADLQKRPVGWCKRLSETKLCLDPTVKMPINGGWGDCPEDKQVALPNTGAGRLTIIQNLDRWTKFRGLFKRIMVLPSDWSYLGKPDTKDLFKKYGTDEQYWKHMFSQSWKKVSELGWEGQLSQCSKVDCTSAAGILSCPVQEKGIGNAQNKRATKRMQKGRAALGLRPFVRPEKLNFAKDKCEPPIIAETCELVGGFGVKAKLSCGGGFVHYCTTEAAAAAEKQIDDDWRHGGGKEPSCTADITSATASMLDTDTTTLS